MTCTRSRKKMNSLGRALCLALLLCAAPSGAIAVEDDAKSAVEATIAEALEVLRNDELSSQAKRGRLEELAYQRFDFERMSRLVLARSWKKLSEQQRTDFEAEFKRHLALTYGRNLESYADEDLAVGDLRKHSNGDITVESSVVGGNNDGARVDYRMRERDGKWYAIDVIVEGVSLISNFRSQVQEIISNKGADRLIETLREKNAKEEAQTS
jgi:phospholipid transport system substrate-binding protein